MASDDDKTVFGGGLPTPPRKPAGQQPQRPSPQQGAEKTVFGAPIPPPGGGRSGQSGQRPPPPQPQQPPQGGWSGGGGDDTWLGGALQPPGATPQPPRPAAPVPPVQPSYQPQPPQRAPHYQPASVGRSGAEMFPEYADPAAQPERRQQPRIALEDALRATGLGAGASSNPLIAAAANLLILLGRLRTGLVALDSGPLIEHVAREIDLFEKNALDAGMTPQDASDGKYALSATADDIVQNLPGADRSIWIQYAMVARFFGERSSGVGFFQKMDDAMRAPAQRYYLLELMLACLSLGFQGQYREIPNGDVELARARSAIYQSLRRVNPRPDDDISPRWTPVIVKGRRRRGGPPVWLVAGVAAAMVVVLYATLSTLLARQTIATTEGIIALHRGAPSLSIERTEPVIQTYQAPDTTQLERIRAALSAEIAAGEVEVERNNEFIFVRVGDALRFGSGSADLTSDFQTLAEAIGSTFETESGPIRVVGHTDSIPPSGRGRYKTNEDLSVARAQTVSDVISAYITDPERLEVEGKGAVDPIADNGTPEGRARNRRVEVMIQREAAP